MTDKWDKQGEEGRKTQSAADKRTDALNKQIEGSDAPVEPTKIGTGLSDPDPGGVNLPNAGDPVAESARVEGEAIGITVDTKTGKRLSPEDAKKVVQDRNDAQAQTDKAMAASKDDPDKVAEAV